MNKTKIDWATMSWNPVTGCRHGCPYCYARRTAHRFDAGRADPARWLMASMSWSARSRPHRTPMDLSQHCTATG